MSRKITVTLTQEITKEVTVTVPEPREGDAEELNVALEEAIERLPLWVEADGEWSVKSFRNH